MVLGSPRFQLPTVIPSYVISDPVILILPAIFGCVQALVFPSTKALVSNQAEQQQLGAGMGLTGSLNNAAKVIGPILGGLFIRGFGFEFTLQLLGLMLLGAAGFIGLWAKLSDQLPVSSDQSPAPDLISR